MVDSWSPAPNGGEPPVYFERERFVQRIGEFSSVLGGGRFATGLIICGSRGVGKTLELHRLVAKLLENGVLPVRVVLGGFDSLDRAIDRALDMALGERRQSRSDGAKSKFAAKIQLTPVEVSYERERVALPPQAPARLLAVVEDVIGPQLGGIALLIDEADALKDGEFSDQLSEILEYASSQNAPVGVVVAGVSRDIWRRTAQGRRSYAESLFDPVWLPRLDTAQTTELLIKSAAMFGDDWTSLDLEQLVRVTHGIPRAIQAGGQDLWRRLRDGDDPTRAPDSVAASLHGRTQILLNMGGDDPSAEALAVAAIRRHRGQEMTIESLLLGSDTAGVIATAEAGVDVVRGLESLHSRGLLEIDYWNSVTPLFLFDAERVSRGEPHGLF